MEAGPLVAVLVVACVEERRATTAGLFELVGKLIKHLLDLGLVALQALGVEPDVIGDPFGLHVLAGIFAFFKQAVHEDCFDPFGVENIFRAHRFSFSVFAVVVD